MLEGRRHDGNITTCEGDEVGVREVCKGEMRWVVLGQNRKTQTSSDNGPNCFKIVKTRLEV